MVLLWGHEKKLVHRDLKPDNILISDHNDVTVIDLGILRETGAPGITASHVPFGPLTPQYTSPEQANNDKRNISFKSDFFALATIAYELLAKTHPFVTDPKLSFTQILANVLNHTPPRLDSITSCSKAFATTIEKMMQKEPYRRHRTVAILKDELSNLKGAYA